MTIPSPSPVWRLLCGLFILTLAEAPLSAKAVYPPVIEGAQVEVYKTVDELDLKVWIFNPEGHTAEDLTPAIVFFFGGGWNNGSPSHFLRQAQYLSNRGMAAVLVDYRVKSRNGVPAVKCVEDAKSAMRWVRTNADRLGIDPERIAAGGGSAGGHLAACTGTVPLYDLPEEDLEVSSKPDAMVLFNPVLVLDRVEDYLPYNEDKLRALPRRLGVEPATLSPYHNLRSDLPPAIVFHGTADAIVPYPHVEYFVNRSKELGNRCELFTYEGAGHGFFNGPKYYADTMAKVDAFLVSLGYLDKQ